ncbi:LOW QUALITY PROTEIN: spaetzle-processing enzyme [Culex quinquefasciatus]|uniref:LOW QUALITY PROTEIN: spaetzle-processing enzyme n=1 Tax=Culex quinquefasciatus TaxID=7176 RepID=UPI0018E37E54|nr:LOW QUALITY PROTEIN: spaetzle-processing enzyme [Culex quinquefasciatus]
MRECGICWLLLAGLGFSVLFSVQSGTINAVSDDASEESVETSSVPAFVRSRFNLRVWSTTEAPNGTETTTTVKPKRPKITTTTEVVDLEVTTSELAVSEVTSTVSSTTVAEDVPRKVVETSASEVVSIPVKRLSTWRKDIAVIRLAERVNITERIRPVCLPGSDRFNYTELHFHVCKKDKQQFGRTSSFSKLVAVTSLTQKDCQILFRRHQAELGPKEFCAWDETGDNCTGDLGGPLMVKLQGRYHVVGLNSYALAKSKIDSEGLPGVYVRVGSFIKWIHAVLKTEFDDSP